MNLNRKGLLVTIIVMLAATTGFAQQMKTLTLSGDDFEGQPYMLEELGALVVQHKDGALEVLHIGSADHRPEAYKDVDLKTGDKILMANGHKLKTTEDLKAAIEDSKIGEKIKFGIKRGKDVRMVSYIKADPADLPQREMMMIGGPGGGESDDLFARRDGEEISISPLMGSGLLFSWNDDAAEVVFLMPHAAKTLGSEADVKEGDRLTALQGIDVENMESLVSQWEAIDTGSEVTMAFTRGDLEFSVTFDKAEAPMGNRVMIKK